jgi:hypothetical protein
MGKLLDSAQAFRLGLFIAYGLILLVVNFVIWHRSGHEELPISVKANTALAANRLLQAGDLRVEVGAHPWYLKRGVAKDQTVALDDLSPMPAIIGKPGKLPVAIAVSQSSVASGELDAGAKGRICQGNKQIVEQVDVQAAFCATSCVAVADIPIDKAATLAAAYQAADPPILQPMSKQCQ